MALEPEFTPGDGSNALDTESPYTQHHIRNVFLSVVSPCLGFLALKFGLTAASEYRTSDDDGTLTIRNDEDDNLSVTFAQNKDKKRK